MSEELKPCPFCGSTSIDPQFALGSDRKYYPGCLDCGASTDNTIVWNTRAAPKGIIEELNEKYAKIFGNSPEYSFWAWLDALDADPTERALQDIYNDPVYWESETL